jgi:ubiquinone/menaquinone biosynthesis C-methylase UbiE
LDERQADREELYSVNYPISQVAETLQAAYDQQYTDKMTEWRELGGKYKAWNILNVCRNHRFAKVLECGAGEGSILKFLDASGIFQELHAIEISDSGVRQIQKRNLRTVREVRKFDGYQIPYADNEFDMAYCSHVIEHVEHPRILLRELKRVSRFQVFEIPLDYSIGVDKKVKQFLSYGHINIYTPSLFKFLLKSEGFEIIDDILTHTNTEVIRFNWYKNMKLKKTIIRELRLRLDLFRRLLRRIRLGKSRYRENGYTHYTCLARGIGDLKIL